MIALIFFSLVGEMMVAFKNMAFPLFALAMIAVTGVGLIAFDKTVDKFVKVTQEDRVFEEQFGEVSPVIVSEMNKSLDEVFTMHPSFLAQEKTIVLGGDTKTDFEDNKDFERIEEELNRQYIFQRGEAINNYDEEMTPQTKRSMFNTEIALIVDHGNYSLKQDSWRDAF